MVPGRFLGERSWRLSCPGEGGGVPLDLAGFVVVSRVSGCLGVVLWLIARWVSRLIWLMVLVCPR